jgi:hypothetical protein
MNDSTKFQPCERGQHEACAAAYFDAQGERHAFGCSCHRQRALFAAPASRHRAFEFTRANATKELHRRKRGDA